MQKYDAIVVGGGHNGLVNAAYLGKAGLKVALLERRPVVGGATITEEIYPGFKYLTGSYLISLLRPQVIRELELPKHGLEILPLESTVAPLPDGNYFADAKTLAKIEDGGQVAFRYAKGTNPNGSVNDIAGIVSEKGNVLGMMPHPENLIEPAHGGMDGRALFEAALDQLEKNAA